jgi:antitoxin component YwqK of YwqJK toxin-antitoxin module
VVLADAARASARAAAVGAGVRRPLVLRRVLGFLGLAVALVATLCACAEIQVVCPEGTGPRRRVFSGGAEAEWCRRDDGVRQGLEVRYYESGAKMLEGAYVDGARFGEWRYYPSEGTAWRRDRWEDGALVEKKITLPERDPNEPPVDVSAPTESLIVKLASADPILGRTVREDELPTFAVWYGNGKPRVLGHYDRDGFRARTWRFWYEGGGLAREVMYDAGVRHGQFREWHDNGQAKTDGDYVDGERDGRWLRWDEAGRPVSDQTYTHGMVSP